MTWKNMNGELSVFHLKIYSKTTISKTAWYQHKNKYIEK